MATKQKSAWFCSECGHKQFKWSGQCPQCSQWNTLHEELMLAPSQRRFEAQNVAANRPMRIREIPIGETPRIKVAIAEFDRLIGGGIVPGSLTLVGGDPGIGKSTLLLQLSYALAKQGLTVLYICGEESVEQTSMRAFRLGIDTDNLLLLNETQFSAIKAHVDQVNPDVLIVDSIQIVYKSDDCLQLQALFLKCVKRPRSSCILPRGAISPLFSLDMSRKQVRSRGPESWSTWSTRFSISKATSSTITA